VLPIQNLQFSSNLLQISLLISIKTCLKIGVPLLCLTKKKRKRKKSIHLHFVISLVFACVKV
jgi:hypothetical protein